MTSFKFIRSEKSRLTLPVTTYKDGKWYVSEIPVFHIASQGKTVEESKANLQDAVKLYFEGENVSKLIKDKMQIPGDFFSSTITFDLARKKFVENPALTC